MTFGISHNISFHFALKKQLTINITLMKNYIITFALFLSAFSVKAQFSGGDGSPEDPYQITTVDQLDSIRYFLDSHFILLNDLDIGDWISNHPDTKLIGVIGKITVLP